MALLFLFSLSLASQHFLGRRSDDGRNLSRRVTPGKLDSGPMQSFKLQGQTFRRAFVLLLVLAISLLFLAMIWPFVKTLFLAAIFSGLMHPVYRTLVKVFRGRKAAASLATLVLVLLLIVGPLTGFLGLVVQQAIDVSQKAIPWVEQNIAPERMHDVEKWLDENAPFLEDVLPDREQLFTVTGKIAQQMGSVLVAVASSATAGTAAFFLHLFVMLYAMFFFLIHGGKVLDRILYYTPLAQEDDERMLERFSSVTRATIKGTFVIAAIQGALGGVAFWAAGVQGAAFWGTIMAILSVIPAVGPTLVWVPAVIYLLISGKILAGILLLAWCAAVVSTVDNILRPILVGRDTKMPDLLILVGTLGGLFFFGPTGFIIGPIVCGLFLSVWDIYGAAFKDLLPPVGASDQPDGPEAKCPPAEEPERVEPETKEGDKTRETGETNVDAGLEAGDPS